METVNNISQQEIKAFSGKRNKLRNRLAVAIEQILGRRHTLTRPNIKRYVLPQLTCFDIRKDTQVSYDDITSALDILRLRRANPTEKPQQTFGVPEDRPSQQPPINWREQIKKRLVKFYTGTDLDKVLAILERSPDRKSFALDHKALTKKHG